MARKLAAALIFIGLGYGTLYLVNHWACIEVPLLSKECEEGLSKGNPFDTLAQHKCSLERTVKLCGITND